MVDSNLLHRLCALAEHRRWLLGVSASARYGRLTVALVATLGSGADCQFEVVAHRRAPVPRPLRKAFWRLQRGTACGPADAAVLASQLAEQQAQLLDEFAADVAPVWHCISATALHGPGLWRRQAGLIGHVELTDAARLADLTGLNVIDGFAQRDLAQDGRGRPLLLLPLWMLLHDPRKPRALLEAGRRPRLTLLPGTRDAAAAGRGLCVKMLVAGESAEPISTAVARYLDETSPRIVELVTCSGPVGQHDWEHLSTAPSDLRVTSVEKLGIAAPALKAAAVAVLGALHLDQAPANIPAATGARTPRVLGRLTPGSVVNWHRLVRELAARRPHVVTLRSAV